MSLKDLKKKSASSLTKLQEEINKINTKESYTDDRYWSPKKDENGNASAIIRFLPANEGETLPWTKLWRHSFQNKATGKWYIENSLTTIGKADPVSEANSELWNTGLEENKKIASDRKRKLSYISNILVVKDPKNPENEGKVFLFSYGVKVFEKIQAVMFPKNDELEEKVEAINPFCPWTGANFKLKIKKVAGYPNYDDSAFSAPSSLFDGDDAKIEEVYKQQHSLAEITDEKNFKSYDDLKKRFDIIVGNTVKQTVVEQKKIVATKTEADAVVASVETEEEEFDPEVEEDYMQNLLRQ